jgi:hypothetical protein
MTKETLDTMKQALEKAKEELSKASYLSECGSNAGIRKVNSNKIDWLRWVVCLAETGLETEESFSDIEVEIREDTEEAPKNKCEECPVTAETGRLIALKDDIIQSLRIENEDLEDKLKSLQLIYDCEVEYRKALAARAKIDHFTEVLKAAHERCWLENGVLVCPIGYLDRRLLELIKE